VGEAHDLVPGDLVGSATERPDSPPLGARYCPITSPTGGKGMIVRTGHHAAHKHLRSVRPATLCDNSEKRQPCEKPRECRGSANETIIAPSTRRLPCRARASNGGLWITLSCRGGKRLGEHRSGERIHRAYCLASSFPCGNTMTGNAADSVTPGFRWASVMSFARRSRLEVRRRARRSAAHPLQGPHNRPRNRRRPGYRCADMW